MESGAVFSECKRYRYALWRAWDRGRRQLMFIGLNPSTADEKHNDPTIKRCIQFAQDWEFGGVMVVNLFAYRATKPVDLFAATDPVGPENDAWLAKLADEAGMIVAAWGNDGSKHQRSLDVRKRFPELFCLKVNKSGEPAHPLYQPKSARPMHYHAPMRLPECPN
ncbi:MAG: hypothetical protein C9356_16360 [Oleiphilus sp.]|nr:MAG: hypothetical protein C9356_16360 [Oleiphilus sp.]